MLRFSSFLCVVFCAFLMPAMAFAQDAKPLNDRTAELLARDACFKNTDPTQSHDICSDWVARAHCLSGYLDLQESFEKTVSPEALFALYEGAETRLIKDANCASMTKIRLWLEILDLGLSEYDPNVINDNTVAAIDKSAPLICRPGSAPCRRFKSAESEQIWRLQQWSKIFAHFQQALPEQQLFICSELSLSPDLKDIYKRNENKAVINACIALSAKLDDIQESSGRMLANFQELDPKLINDDARAVMLALNLKLRQFETAKTELYVIDLTKVSPEAKAHLKKAILTHAANLFGQEQINEGVCYPLGLQAKETSDKGRQVLYDLLLDAPNPLAPFVAQSEMLYNWRACAHEQVAARLAWLFDTLPKDTVVHEIGLNLLNTLQKQRDAKLAFALADAMTDLKAPGLEAFSKKLGPLLAAQILNFSAYLPNDERHKLLKDVRQFSGPTLRPEIDFRLGIALHQDGQTTEALKYWQEVIDRGPNTPWSSEATTLRDRFNATVVK